MDYRVFTDDNFDCQLETIFQGNESFSAVIVSPPPYIEVSFPLFLNVRFFEI